MTVNINNTGVCLLSAEKLETGREVPVTVTLPGNEKIIIRTTVIWARPVENSPTKEYRMGLRIIDPTKPDEKKLVEFYTGKARELGIT